jgi:hypothetical protein
MAYTPSHVALTSAFDQHVDGSLDFEKRPNNCTTQCSSDCRGMFSAAKARKPVEELRNARRLSLVDAPLEILDDPHAKEVVYSAVVGPSPAWKPMNFLSGGLRDVNKTVSFRSSGVPARPSQAM